jgi:hypothetical protein
MAAKDLAESFVFFSSPNVFHSLILIKLASVKRIGLVSVGWNVLVYFLRH